jgi:predicted nucleotidyltransferase
MNLPNDASSEKLAGFCRKWKITELSLFGSVLREDFRPDSDIDVLVTFASLGYAACCTRRCWLGTKPHL